MACFNFVPPATGVFVHYRIARATSEPPRIVQWYCGPIISWIDDPEQAVEFPTRKLAREVREALGCGVIVRVYDMTQGPYVGPI